MRDDLSREEIGLIGLVSNLIVQLLQFSIGEEFSDISNDDIEALDGISASWEAGLRVLQSLLNHTPPVILCVIDGLGDLAWGDGGEWCGQFLEILLARQRRNRMVFHILFTTTSHSQVIPEYISVDDRQISTQSTREILRHGRSLDVALN